jgi:hypothetical protein
MKRFGARTGSGRVRGAVLSMALVAAAIAPLAGPTTAHSLPGAGTGAYTYTYGGADVSLNVYSATGASHRVYISTDTCSADEPIGALEFKTNAGLSSAKLLTQTRCGLVSVKWKGTGQLRVIVGAVLRKASAKGVIGSTYFSAPGSRGAIMVYAHE